MGDLELFGPESPYSEPSDGYLFLGQVVVWVASDGGRLTHDETAQAFEQAERSVFDALSRGAIGAEGANAFGEYSAVPAGVWALASSDYEADRPTVAYNDAIGGPLSGTLAVGSQRWRGIRLRKPDVARLWPFEPRDTLITWVAHGRLSPEEAEAEAARHSLRPLIAPTSDTALDPRSEPFWSLPMALAWLMTGDWESVRQMWDRWRMAEETWVFKRWQVPGGPFHEGYFIESRGAAGLRDLHIREGLWDEAGKLRCSWRSAWEHLSKALESGKLQAYGVPEIGGEREPIPAFKWHDLGLYEDKREKVVVRMKPGLTAGFKDVVVPSATSMTLGSLENTKAVRRGGSAPRYDWPAFTREALKLLEHEGDINPTVDPTWTQAELERRMMDWCARRWERTPTESTIRKYAAAALQQFRKSKAG